MEYNLTDINTVKKLLSAAGFTFSKALGQNFITNPAVCPKMAALSGIAPEDGVLEIGPGVGVLTVELAKTAKTVVSVELDARLLPILAKTLDGRNNVFVEHADILKADLPALAEKYFAPGQKLHVCANLPYYITSPVIMRLLECGVPFASMTLMVQKEAADRLTARLGEREAGVLTAAVEYYAEAETLFTVPASSFTPPPKVNSAVIRLTRRQTPPVEVADEAFFFKTVKAAFLHRRKTAVNSLSAGLGLPKDKIEAALVRLGFSPAVRAEEIDIAKFAALAGMLKEF